MVNKQTTVPKNKIAHFVSRDRCVDVPRGNVSYRTDGTQLCQCHIVDLQRYDISANFTSHGP